MFSTSTLYREDIQHILQSDIPFSMLHDKAVLITGATGLIGTYLVDVLMQKSIHEKMNIMVYAVGRNIQSAQERFGTYLHENNFRFIQWDVNTYCPPSVHVDYIIHAASNTHPKAYASDPVGSILTNLLGLHNILRYGYHTKAERVMFLSSVEIYGEAWKEEDIFDESYCGYIDCNTLRAGYPEGKRAGESLCQAYIAKYGMDIVIPRLSRVYGATMRRSDSKAMAQFIWNSVYHEDIVLKSSGTQRFSYLYAADAASALLFLLCRGETGSAYNLAGKEPILTLREIASILAQVNNKKIVLDLPDDVEKQGFSKATTAVMSVEKIRSLGWTARYDTVSGLKRTVGIIREGV